MNKPLMAKEPVTKWWAIYKEWRAKKGLAIGTYEIDDSTKLQLDAFFENNPTLNDIHVWDVAALTKLYTFMIGDDQDLSETTAEIYMEAFRTFYGYLVNEAEVITRNPFKKYEYTAVR